MNFNDLTLPDGSATPVTQTFKRESNKNGVAIWSNRVSGVPASYPKITQSIKEPNKDTPNYRVEVRVALPALETPGPGSGSGYVAPPAEAYRLLMALTTSCNHRSTLQQRQDTLAYFTAYIQTPEFVNSFVNYESIY